jgi:2-polyprenyl-3-methyl-5-hydroxy-6-metoxy-1,4-benzoquinol methylase
LTLDLNDQPLANTYPPTADDNEPYYPLAVNRCTDCCHLQLTHIVDPELIYKDYAYVSGTSQTYLDYMSWFAKWCREYSDLWRGHVLDIGCNDGSQLDAFDKLGYNTYGVDPAENLYETSSAKGHKVVCGFWNKKTIKQLKHDRFDIVVCQNAFAHNPDPVKFLELLDEVTRDRSHVFIQTSQADMVANGEFDTIYHEHISFYNINSFNAMVKRTAFYLTDVIKTPIHGTSYVFVLTKNKKRPKHIANLVDMEKKLLEPKTYVEWENRANTIAKEFANIINEYRAKRYKIVGYGAAAKGNTLLNFAEVDLDIIVDDNPLKQNRVSPGRDIPIVSMDYVTMNYSRSDRILFVPLAWNFFKEIKNKIKQVRDVDTDVFLRYFPEVEVAV